MSDDTQWDIKPIQQEVLKIFKAFASVCKRHGLRYFAAYGTALGAVRHSGFIPWDDDFDVVMPRPDFMRLVDVIESELPVGLHFKRGGEGFPSPIYFAHIVNDSVGLIDELSRKSQLDLEIGPYIDIFVLDGIPDDLSGLPSWVRSRKYVRMCQMYRYPETVANRKGFSKLRSILGRVLGFFVSWNYKSTKDNKEMMKVMDSIFNCWPYDRSRSVVEYMFFRNKSSRIIPRSMFGEGRMVPFCDTEICVPSGVEMILEQYYGDYLTYPPEKDRKPPHIMKLLYEGHV